jgi:hypothetical protein
MPFSYVDDKDTKTGTLFFYFLTGVVSLPILVQQDRLLDTLTSILKMRIADKTGEQGLDDSMKTI